MAVLQHQRHQRGARRVGHAFVNGVAHYFALRQHQGRFQKGIDIGDLGRGFFLVSRRHRFQGQLGRYLALGMTAHAVGQQKNAGVAGVAIPHAILIVLAPAFSA